MNNDINNTPGHIVLYALAYLHEKGYEELRICCGRSPSGMYWRYCIQPKRKFEPENGLLVSNFTNSNYPFGSITKATQLPGTPAELAESWLINYPFIKLGKGADPEYVQWYKTLLHALELEMALPVMFADYEIDTSKGFEVGKTLLPLPAFK